MTGRIVPPCRQCGGVLVSQFEVAKGRCTPCFEDPSRGVLSSVVRARSTPFPANLRVTSSVTYMPPQCRSCGDELPEQKNGRGGLCDTCAGDGPQCVCGAALKNGQKHCSACETIFAVNELDDQLYKRRAATTNEWIVGRRSISIRIPSTEYDSSRYNKLESLKRWHAQLDAEEAKLMTGTCRDFERSPWPRCAVHSKDGRAWLVSLAAAHSRPLPDDFQWSCSCQW